MILTDASALVAIIDRDEPDHARCVAALDRLTPPMTTTLPALTEAAYLLRRRRAEPVLWRLLRRRDLTVRFLDDTLLVRSLDLVERYRDLPMALADATLVAVAEASGDRRIFSVDADFRIYRIRGGHALEVIP